MTAHAQAEVRDLEALVLAGDVGGVAAACEAGTPPSNRTALVATCKQILGKGFWSMSAGYTGDQVDAAAVASTAHATIAEVRAIRTPWKIPRDLDLAFRLVRARDESFRDGWAAHAIESLDARGAFVARRLIASGASRKPPSDAYTIALVSRPGAFDLTAKAGAWGRKGVIDVLARESRPPDRRRVAHLRSRGRRREQPRRARQVLPGKRELACRPRRAEQRGSSEPRAPARREPRRFATRLRPVPRAVVLGISRGAQADGRRACGEGEHLPLAHREPNRAHRLDGAEGPSAGRAGDSPRRGRGRRADRTGGAGSEQGFGHAGARTLGTRRRVRARSPAPSRKPRRRSTRSWER